MGVSASVQVLRIQMGVQHGCTPMHDICELILVPLLPLAGEHVSEVARTECL